jgi:hypothetical protein
LIACSDVGKFYGEDGTFKPIYEITPDDRRAISGRKPLSLRPPARRGYIRKLWLFDKGATLTQLGRSQRMFVDRMEVEQQPGPSNQPGVREKNSPSTLRIGQSPWREEMICYQLAELAHAARGDARIRKLLTDVIDSSNEPDGQRSRGCNGLVN